MNNHNRSKTKDSSRKSSLNDFIISTRFLAFGSWAIGGIVLFVGSFLIDRFLVNSYQDLYIGVLLIAVMPWLILGSLIIVIRKEMPRLGLPSIKGKPALIQGYVGVVGFSVIEIGLIVYLLLSLE